MKKLKKSTIKDNIEIAMQQILFTLQVEASKKIKKMIAGISKKLTKEIRRELKKEQKKETKALKKPPVKRPAAKRKTL